MRKSIAIFFVEDRKLDTYPYILNLIKLLSESGFDVDFFSTTQMCQQHPINGFNCIDICDYSESDYRYTKNCIKWINKSNKNYDFFVSFSLHGLWVLLYQNYIKFKGLKCAYFNMEFYDFNLESRKIFKILYRANILLKPFLKFVVSQDKNRLKFINRKFPICKKSFTLPNSYIGFHDNDGDFAYRKFNIDKNKKILLYSGAIEEWALEEEMIECLSTLLNKEYVLLLNGFSRDGYANKLVAKYQDLISEKKLIVSLETLCEDLYTELVKSVFLGLCWYKKLTPEERRGAVGQNVYNMGLSSGKLCKYLSCSLPIIIPDFYFGYKNLVARNKIGETYSSLSDTCEKIEKVANNYEYYQKNVESYYNNCIEYKTKSRPIIDEIIKITNK